MKFDLKHLGWSASFQRAFEVVDDGGLIPGRVVREDRGNYIVNTGMRTVGARLKGSLLEAFSDSAEYPTIGDWLALRPIAHGDSLVIEALLPRRSLFERQAAGAASRNQSVAANFDTLFLVCGLDGDFNLHRLQRYLSLAWNSGAQPVVVLNKSDLRDDLQAVRSQVAAVAPGAPLHFVSAMRPETLASLTEYLGVGETVALLGSSGVGKSTLVNALLGEVRVATQSNRSDDSRGRHTTTWRELHLLPQGGVLIDLPGMRELQLTGESAGLEKAFTDVRQLASQCRFRDCRHNGEPGCAVAEALATGTLEEDRFHQYLKLSGENAVAKRRKAERVSKLESKQPRLQEKKRFFKEVTVQRRKAAKAERKFRSGDGG